MAEFLGGGDGLGGPMITSWQRLQTWDVSAALLTVCIVAVLLDRTLILVRTAVTRWA